MEQAIIFPCLKLEDMASKKGYNSFWAKHQTRGFPYGKVF